MGSHHDKKREKTPEVTHGFFLTRNTPEGLKKVVVNTCNVLNIFTSVFCARQIKFC